MPLTASFLVLPNLTRGVVFNFTIDYVCVHIKRLLNAFHVVSVCMVQLILFEPPLCCHIGLTCQCFCTSTNPQHPGSCPLYLTVTQDATAAPVCGSRVKNVKTREKRAVAFGLMPQWGGVIAAETAERCLAVGDWRWFLKLLQPGHPLRWRALVSGLWPPESSH